MIFSTKTIQSINNRKENKSIIESYDDHSFFNEYLDIALRESLENNSLILDVFNEGFITKSFSKIFNTIIDKFKNLIRSLHDKLTGFIITTQRKSDVFEHYDKELKNITISIEYPRAREKYTNLDASTSCTSNMTSILNSEFNTLNEQIKSISSQKSIEDIIDKLKTINDETKPDQTYYDSIRGKIISGSGNSISKEEYSKKLIEYFRNNDKGYPANSTIEASEIKEIYKRYLNYKDDIRKINKEKSDIEAFCENTKKKFKSLNLEKKSSIQSNETINKAFDNIIKNECMRVKECCTIFGLYFSIKFDMMKDERKQNIEVLTEVCKKLSNDRWEKSYNKLKRSVNYGNKRNI